MKTFTRLLQSLVCALLSILVLLSSSQAQTGSLTGVVRNCVTNAPIAGAMVSCAGHTGITNASGNYTVTSIPAGNQTAMATCPGYTPFSAPVVIIANQTTTFNICMFPVPGLLMGTITDCTSGFPVPGAKISWGTYSTYAAAGGIYSMNIYTGGTNVLSVSKPGYSTYSQAGVTVTPPNTVSVNVVLNPQLYPPDGVTAVLNAGQTATVINWNPAMSSVELGYDDWGAEQCVLYHIQGSISAVKFTPCGYPAVLRRFMVNVCGPNFAAPAQVNVYATDGPGGMPGTILGGVTFTPSSTGWNEFSFSAPVTVASGSFYIGMVQLGDQTSSPGMSIDTTTNQVRSYQKIGAGPWVIAGGNYMIHAIMDEPCGLIPATGISYTVFRFLQGQESNPALWVQVGTVTGSTFTVTDNSWPSLSCGPYRWGVKPGIPCNSNMTAGFSNVIGKCWTSMVTFHAQKCCPSMGKDGINILVQNLSLPDTVYSVTTDTSGTAVIPTLWKGNYSIIVSVFGCNTYMQTPVSITGDMTFTPNLGGGPGFAPYYLHIIDTTNLATWYPPKIVIPLLDEKWSSANFTANNWTVSGGTNWQISTGVGNPSPSAIFNYTPVVQNYDEYLTSKTITDTNSTIKQLLYDINFNSYGTTTMNTLAVETWDGVGWNTIKTYDNMGGNIPWKSEVLNITPYIGTTFKIRFHAHGGDSNDINWWDLDNIKIQGVSDPPCLLGYDFSLNNTLSGFTADTFYWIPPDQILYGHTYHACVKAVYDYGLSGPACVDFTSHYLCPPLNFRADSMDCTVVLTWQQPVNGPGPICLGYRIYRNNTLIATIADPNVEAYYDYNLDPGIYHYACQAQYNVAPYHPPTFIDYSRRANDPVEIICGDQMPFMENWTSNNFSYNDWTFDPSQGNWTSTSITGNPAPAADFSFSGKKSTGDVNYDYSLVSRIMDGSEWTCSHLFLDFDLKLVDHNSSSTEKMAVEIMYNHTWHSLGEFTNNGSFGWDTESFTIDSVRGKGFRIRFRAHGANTNNILHWYIDNIHLYGNCLPPAALHWTSNSQEVSLAWTAPCSNITGYNVFRSDSLGNPPYSKVNQGLVTGTSYTDVPPGWSSNDSYRYYVTALQMNTVTGTSLCEPASDTVLAAYSTGIPVIPEARISIYPNPADHYFMIRSDQPLTRVEVISDLGNVMYSETCDSEKQLEINTAGFSQGICFVRIFTEKGIWFRKVVICR
jgi:hypothetical protein